MSKVFTYPTSAEIVFADNKRNTTFVATAFYHTSVYLCIEVKNRKRQLLERIQSGTHPKDLDRAHKRSLKDLKMGKLHKYEVTGRMIKIQEDEYGVLKEIQNI